MGLSMYIVCRRVEAGQPHVPHDHQPERVVRVLDPLGEQLPAGLASDVALPMRRVRRRAGHDDLDDAAFVVVAVPVPAQPDDLAVERNADAAAHADDHGLAVHAGNTTLEMVDQIPGNQAQALLRPDDGLDVRQSSLEPFLLAFGLVLDQFGDLVVERRLLTFVEFDADEAALVVDRYGRAVFDAAVDVVDVDVIAEHGRRVHILPFDRRAGEADEGSVRQGVAQIFGEAVGNLSGLAGHPGAETVLAAVRLVRDHDDVAAVGEGRVFDLAGLGCELLEGGEHHAAGRTRQSLSQVLPAVGLPRGLAEQVAAHGERAEQLVVEVVAVGEDHEGRVLHRRVGDDLSGVERHQQALAGALRVPDHADTAIACRARRGDRALDRMAYGVKLVIAGHDLDQSRARVPEHGEVPDQGQEPVLLEHAFDDGFDLGGALRCDGGAVHGAPGHEPLKIGGQRSEPRLKAVRSHESGIGAEQGRYLLLVGPELVERPFEGGVFVAGVLHLDHGQRQAIEEQHDVGAAIVFVLDHRELVHRQPVVGLDVVEIDQTGSVAADAAVLPRHLDRHARDQVAVQAAVLLDEGGSLRLPHLAEHLLQRRGGQVRVEAGERLAEPAGQQHLVVAAPLRRRAFRAHVRPMNHGIAQSGEPCESRVFDIRFGKTAHSPDSPRRLTIRRIMRSLFDGALSAINRVSAVNPRGSSRCAIPSCVR